MTLDQDWERLTKACEKLIQVSPHPNTKIFFGIEELRKADNKGIDFVIRRLKASDRYGRRIRLYGAPTSKMPKYPLRVKTNGTSGFHWYKFDSISIKETNSRTSNKQIKRTT